MERFVGGSVGVRGAAGFESTDGFCDQEAGVLR